jgi:hypothetical protein
VIVAGVHVRSTSIAPKSSIKGSSADDQEPSPSAASVIRKSPRGASMCAPTVSGRQASSVMTV